MAQQESDFKSQLVLEICSFSARSIACAHRQYPNSNFIDWYRLLGVEENADIDDIRKRYHKLALQLHPDKNNHPKADIAFKLVLEAYSCLSDNLRRKTFNLERWEHFCLECNSIPYTQCSSLSNARSPKLAASFSKPYQVLRGLKDIRERFREEAKVMESCLKANAALRKESPVFTPSDCRFQSNNQYYIPRKESPVFDPSDNRVEGYPHVRNRMCKNPESLWQLHRKNIPNFGQGRYASPIFESRSDRGMFRSKSTCVRS